MRTSAAFTPSFFNTIPTDEAPGPSQPARGEAAPLTYSSEKYGTVESFIHSAAFGAFKQEYTDVLDRITAFVHDYAGQIDPPILDETKHKVKADFDALKTRLFDLKQNVFGDSRSQMYGTGKEMFHELDSVLKKGNIPLQQRMNAVLALAPRAQVCAGGLLSDLQETIARLKTPRNGLKGAAYQWKKKMLQALILEHVQANHEYSEAMEDWEIHYVNAYYNGLAAEMGVSTLVDPYVIKTISDEQLKKCGKHVFAKLNPTRLATMLADEYRSRVEASFGENAMAADNLSFENIKTLQAIQEAELDPEYGPVPVHAFVAPTDPEDYGSPQAYSGGQRPIGVTRHFLKALKQQELIDYDKESKIVLADTDEGRILMLGDLLWIKDKDGEPQELTLQSSLQIDPEVLLGNIEKAAPEDAQARDFLLRTIVGRVHEQLEAAGDTGELLGKWLRSFAPAIEKRQPLDQERTGSLILRAANSLRSYISAMGKPQALASKWTAPLILHAAVNHASALRDLLKAGGDKNATGEDGRTVLMLAAQGGHTEATNVLIEAGADKDAQDMHGQTALMLAAEKGKIEALKVLIAAGAKKEAKGKLGRTALMCAAGKGHVDAVQVLLGASANKEATDDYKQTALMYAADKGHVDAMQALLDASANREAMNRFGKTALMYAADKGHVDAMQALLLTHADAKLKLVEAKDYSGWTALMQAASKGHANAVQVLLDAGANKDAESNNKRTALMLAAENGKVEALKVLLDAGAELEATNFSGKTALIYAAGNNHDGVVQALLAKGANKDAQDMHGQTALMVAAGKGKVKTLKVLIAASANKEATDMYDRTALMYAARRGHADAVQALLDGGADMKSMDDEGHTAMIWAARMGKIGIVKALIQHGADGVNELMAAAGNDSEMAVIRNSHEVTAVKSNSEVAAMLIQAGADGAAALMLAARDDHDRAKTLIQAGADGATALVKLAEQGSRYRLKRLIAVGADKVRDAEGKTALMRAVEMAGPGNDKVLKALLAAGADTTTINSEVAAMLIQAGADGVTALMIAVRHSREMTATLIQAGADGATALLKLAEKGSRHRLKRLIGVGADKVKDGEGKTALMRAVEMAGLGNDKVLKALLAAGADTTIQDNEGKTAKEHADELVAASGNNAASLAFIEAAIRSSPGA